MKNIFRTLRTLTIITAFLSIAFFVFDLFVLEKLRPKMLAFDPLSGLEESLLTWVGIGLMVILLFFVLSLLQVVRYIKDTSIIKPVPLIFVIAGVFSLLFVFSDVALITDIHKQYRHGLPQPEWSLLYPMLGFQFILALLFTYLHLSGFFVQEQVNIANRDVNVFLVVQYIGLVCGLLGLAFACLGFVFPHSWTLLHSTMNVVVLLFPYALAVLLWWIIKRREQDRQWFDEKQRQDIGTSALLTLAINLFYMTVLFIFNYQNLAGIMSVLWFPLHLFGILFLFSLGNLYLSSKN